MSGTVKGKCRPEEGRDKSIKGGGFMPFAMKREVQGKWIQRYRMSWGWILIGEEIRIKEIQRHAPFGQHGVAWWREKKWKILKGEMPSSGPSCGIKA